MTAHLIEGLDGEVHEIGDDERALVLAKGPECAHDWFRRNGIPPFGRQFTINPTPRQLQGGRWPVIIKFTCFPSHPESFEIQRIVERNVLKMQPGSVRTIRARCP